jgi:hypothetical protein
MESGTDKVPGMAMTEVAEKNSSSKDNVSESSSQAESTSSGDGPLEAIRPKITFDSLGPVNSAYKMPAVSFNNNAISSDRQFVSSPLAQTHSSMESSTPLLDSALVEGQGIKSGIVGSVRAPRSKTIKNQQKMMSAIASTDARYAGSVRSRASSGNHEAPLENPIAYLDDIRNDLDLKFGYVTPLSFS